ARLGEDPRHELGRQGRTKEGCDDRTEDDEAGEDDEAEDDDASAHDDAEASEGLAINFARDELARRTATRKTRSDRLPTNTRAPHRHAGTRRRVLRAAPATRYLRHGTRQAHQNQDRPPKAPPRDRAR